VGKEQELPGIPIEGRKSASIVRNRLALMRATQRALADHGIHVTNEQIAEAAGITISTIYQHFDNKEELILAANLMAFAEWEQWAESVAAQSTDQLTRLVLPMRLMVRMQQTHPLTARVASSNLAMLYELMPILIAGISRQLVSIAELNLLDSKEIKIRATNVTNCVVAAFTRHAKDPSFSAKDADEAIRISLKMLNITAEQGHELMSQKLPPLIVVGAP
jgi:AcrR family transcriptional regulator